MAERGTVEPQLDGDLRRIRSGGFLYRCHDLNRLNAKMMRQKKKGGLLQSRQVEVSRSLTARSCMTIHHMERSKWGSVIIYHSICLVTAHSRISPPIFRFLRCFLRFFFALTLWRLVGRGENPVGPGTSVPGGVRTRSVYLNCHGRAQPNTE